MPWSFSDLILQWISALHLSPSTSVIYASRLSAPFPILRGTEQGCPLSPILLAIEPLAVALREDPNVTGIQYPSIHYKVSLYVDDTLLILTSPLSTLPNFQHLLSSFLGLLGGLIPPKKSLHWISPFQPRLYHSYKPLFPLAEDTLSYSSLFVANYYPLLQSLTSPMQSPLCRGLAAIMR